MKPIQISTSDQKKLDSGLGQGTGRNYTSFIKFTDFSSNGGNHIKCGILIDRNYLLLSDLEHYTFRILESFKDVIDIREQYPLLPLSNTFLIANQLNVTHPINNKTNELRIMTSDFVVTFRDKTVVYTNKYTAELEDRRVIEKLSIEREYWRQRGIDYRIITEEDIDLTLARNLIMLSDYYYREDLGPIGGNKTEFGLLCHCFKESYPRREDSIYSFIRKFEETYLLEPGQGFFLFYYLLAHRKIIVDLTVPLNKTIREK